MLLRPSPLVASGHHQAMQPSARPPASYPLAEGRRVTLQLHQNLQGLVASLDPRGLYLDVLVLRPFRIKLNE